MKQRLKISVVIPTFNNDEKMKDCLNAVFNQNYPKKLIEVIVSDGGSKDRTLSIAKKFGCRIVKNPYRLAEYGVSIGVRHAKGDLRMILAADNVLSGKDFMNLIVEPFLKEKDVMIVFPTHVSADDDTWITKYINAFTDPINHFIYGKASNGRTFHKVYPILKKTENYTIFDYYNKDYPLIALAQGTTISKSMKRDIGDMGDDILPIVTCISHRYKIAYAFKAELFHHTVKSLSHFIRKQRWAAANFFLKEQYGINSRIRFFSWRRRLKFAIWPIYAATIIPPLTNSILGLITERRIEWMYHPVLTYLSLWAVLYEFVRIKILRKERIQRQA